MLPPHLQARQGSFESDAYLAIQNHAGLGATLLQPFSFLRDATFMIAHHHERWDGSGYPYGLRKESIPFGARILAVADAFVAIQVPDVHDRSIRDYIALRILRVASGTQFDPIVVNLFVELTSHIFTSDQLPPSLYRQRPFTSRVLLPPRSN